MYLPLLLPQSAHFLRLVIYDQKTGQIILRSSWKVREWMAIKMLAWRSAYMTPTRACTHTHAYTKNPLGRISCFFVETTINTEKETDFTSETLSSCSTNIGAPSYDQVCIIIHPYQHRRMSGFLFFLSFELYAFVSRPYFF